MVTQELKARFEEKFTKGSKEECWNWQASTAGKGYGQIKIPGTRRQIYAHRLSYLIYSGEIPDGLEVCHSCDNPACVNPGHLFLGTRKENQEDMKRKFRSTFGERNARAKLKEKDVIQILKMLDAKIPQIKIAEFFGISQIQVSRIHTKKQWSHIVLLKYDSIGPSP